MPTPHEALPRHLSLWLDLVRCVAALTVAIGHFGTQLVSGGLFYQVSLIGPAAVDVFFVLSGFVVAHSLTTRRQTLRDYTLARLSRLYSVVIPALIVTLLLDAIGSGLNPAHYARVPQFDPASAWLAYPAAIFFMGEVWFAALQPGTNLPYWSLGFEAWYYLLFAIAVFAPARWRAWLLLLAIGLAGPKILLLFPLWLLGVACHHLCRRPPPAVGISLILALLPPALLMVWTGWTHRIWQTYAPFDGNPAIMLDHVKDYAVGLAFAVHIIGVRGLGPLLPAASPAAIRVIRWLGGVTFGIYLFHYPVMQACAALLPWPAGSSASRLGIGLIGGACILALARSTEATKPAWHRLLARLWPERSLSHGR